MKSILIGTSYFVSKAAALQYFLPYEGRDYVIDVVNRKLKAGEIHIGVPPLRPGDSLRLIDDRCRYAIRTAGDATPDR